MLSIFTNCFNWLTKFPEDPTWEELQKKYPYMDVNPDYTLPCSGTGPIKTDPSCSGIPISYKEV